MFCVNKLQCLINHCRMYSVYVCEERVHRWADCVFCVFGQTTKKKKKKRSKSCAKASANTHLHPLVSAALLYCAGKPPRSKMCKSQTRQERVVYASAYSECETIVWKGRVQNHAFFRPVWSVHAIDSDDSGSDVRDWQSVDSIYSTIVLDMLGL